MTYRNAISVSAVSPDCEIKKQTSSRNTGVFLSKKSDASSTITGNSVNSSRSWRVATAEW
ncbi:GSCOCG00005831001-RA-CDS [Cotesia congregata]|nr:GSCOCG00005831001-RA-CDS [Cotesia congregata]